ncbi:3-isopropylmalate dehydratase large subunit [Candidatus Portiera aleyrodidarum]|uniref:3-isopropylmalate dehydratase large subunit n=1 Tax=Candidatus Portiera aleyrodidarum MED (Bemisia tabaci) TaxID=1163752 RepID=A0AAU8RQT7_9GAMM|nr:3-isopropylmalate dehydratase large subunit [Candidatus Portiera aleyrodidarum]AFS18879.1 3-isopropylmalate dehydratase large subunit [Candidatus Portiera aleyrodidarum BT-QVLC]AFT80512.1 3-isopropylmalate dehydratase large subunit [Candidatus Portiera aleyrodidarum BT-QVLC]AJF24092.1 isopropylmalate isomerase [Candidatus Portiera aleyrodidarum MED (Bemisia tabaci)]
MTGQTLYEKIWSAHLIKSREDGTALIYIDRHLLHEVTSPQAFDGLRLNKRKIWRVDTNIATVDHNVPTNVEERIHGIKDELSRIQINLLKKNCKDFLINKFFNIKDVRQGIVHVIGPEIGATLPGMTVVCGDSHTSTHGAFAALAYGIGTSEVEHVLATQCLLQRKLKNMKVCINGELSVKVTAKDLILSIINIISTDGGTGYAVEFTGSTIKTLSMEGRMTICNMAIEAGAKVGLISVDQNASNYLHGRALVPNIIWNKAIIKWKNLFSDYDAKFDEYIKINAKNIEPQVSWGTQPDMVVGVNGKIPNPKDYPKPDRKNIELAIKYMGLKSEQKIVDIKIDRIFIGSCTNSRIEDLRIAANFLKNNHIAATIKEAIVVPGSGYVKKQAELEGLDEVFISAGFEWREPGCSMCLAMNSDKLDLGDRCASTSNRNYESRQGYGGRTHLVSPAMAAAASIAGHLIDVR